VYVLWANTRTFALTWFWSLVGAVLCMIPLIAVSRLRGSGLARELSAVDTAAIALLGVVLVGDTSRRLSWLYEALPLLPLFGLADLAIGRLPRSWLPLSPIDYLGINACLGLLVGRFFPDRSGRRAAIGFSLLLTYMLTRWAGYRLVLTGLHSVAAPRLRWDLLGFTLADGVLFCAVAEGVGRWILKRRSKAATPCAEPDREESSRPGSR